MILSAYGIPAGYSAVNITDDVYLVGENTGSGSLPGEGRHQVGMEFIGKLPGFAVRTVNYEDFIFDLYEDIAANSRPVLVSRAGRVQAQDVDFYRRAARGEVMIYTDYWEY